MRHVAMTTKVPRNRESAGHRAELRRGESVPVELLRCSGAHAYSVVPRAVPGAGSGQGLLLAPAPPSRTKLTPHNPLKHAGRGRIEWPLSYSSLLLCPTWPAGGAELLGTRRGGDGVQPRRSQRRKARRAGVCARAAGGGEAAILSDAAGAARRLPRGAPGRQDTGGEPAVHARALGIAGGNITPLCLAIPPNPNNNKIRTSVVPKEKESGKVGNVGRLVDTPLIPTYPVLSSRRRQLALSLVLSGTYIVPEPLPPLAGSPFSRSVPIRLSYVAVALRVL